MKLVVFGAAWCGPCKKQKEILREMSLSIPVEYKDVEEDAAEAQQMHVRSVPTMFLVQGTTICWQHNGLATENEISRAIGVYQR